MKPKGKKVKSTQQLSQEMPIFIQNRNNPFFSGKKGNEDFKNCSRHRKKWTKKFKYGSNKNLAVYSRIT